MKRFLIVLVSLMMILSIGTIDVQAAQNWDGQQSSTSTIVTVEDLKVKINNQAVDFNSFPPYRTVNGIMVPVAEAAKAAGASVEYMKITKEVKVKLNDITMIFQAGRRAVLVNGKSYVMGDNAVNIDGKIYVPVRFLYERLGGTVTWDAKTGTVQVLIIKTATKPVTVPTTSGISIDMPESKGFKPYLSELSPIDPDILKELQAYKDDSDGELRYKKNGVGVNFYKTNEEVIASVGLNDVKEQCVFAKSMMEVENNVDYRTSGANFIQQYRYFFMPESGRNWTIDGVNYSVEDYIKLRYNDVKKFKIIEKAEFYTDTSLVYDDKNSDNRIRGRLKFMFESVNPEYFKTYDLPKYELNKWYISDLEIIDTITFTRNNKWPHSYYTYDSRVFISDNILMK